MGQSYDESVKTIYEAQSFDAGIDGWDGIIQYNNVRNRRYAMQSPFSLIARKMNFEGGIDFSAVAREQVMLDLSGQTANLMFIPTMVGLMLHPLGVSAGFTAPSIEADRMCISVSNSMSMNTEMAVTADFCIAPSGMVAASTPTSTVVTTGGANVQPTAGVLPSSLGSTTILTPQLRSPNTTAFTTITQASIESVYGAAKAGFYYMCPIQTLMGVETSLRGQLTAAGVATTVSTTSLIAVLEAAMGYTATAVSDPPNLVTVTRPSGQFRAITLQSNSANSPFFPTGTTDVPYASTATFNRLGLWSTGSKSMKFALVDIYGMVVMANA